MTAEENVVSELKEPFSVFAEFFSGVRYRHQISAGVYRSVGRDSGGAYLKGPDKCLSTTLLAAGWAQKPENVNKVVGIAECGIYLPNDSTEPAKIFVVLGTEVDPTQLAKDGAAGNADKALNDVALANTSPRATPVQAGVGAAIGAAVVTSFVEAENGRFMLIRNQEASPTLRRLLVPVP